MKDLLPIACLIALGACSAAVKREPAPLDPTTPATTSSTTPAAPTQCPALQIKAPDSVPAGQVGQVTLILTDTGGTPTYAWTIAGGTIESGQGTPTITVRAGTVPRTSVTVTVAVGNLPPECDTHLAGASFLVGA